MKVVIASIKRNSRRLKAMAENKGFDPVFVSTLKVVPLDVSDKLNSFIYDEKFSWIVFSSSTAASFFIRINRLTRVLGEAKVAAVGSGTSGFLQRSGIKVDFTPSKYTTETLAEELPVSRGSRIILARSEDGNDRAEMILQKRGAITYRLNLYRTSFVNRPLNRRRVEGAKLIVFGSSKEVQGFENRLSISGIKDFKDKVIASCIGPLTKKTALKMGYRVIDIPKAYTYSSLFAMLGDLRNEGRI
ncbi:MAG: uroporphyrinogen-III synthase [Nitrososphaeria archaeon]